MSPLAASMVAWSGIYVYACVYGIALFLARRDQREHLIFGCLCGSLAIFCAGMAWATDAGDVAHGAVGQRIQGIGLFPAMAFFVDLLLSVAGEERRSLVRGTYAWCGIGTAAAAANLLTDPGDPDPSYAWSLGGAGVEARAAMQPLGAVLVIGGCAVCAYAIGRLITRARERPDLRVAAVLTVLGLSGGVVDTITRVAGWGVPLLSPHSGLLTVLGISYLLAGRLTRIDTELADRKEALARSYGQLRIAQQELVRKEQLATVGELSAVIAHEVRNPLAIIKNAVGGLRRENLGADDAETLLGILDEETDRLNRLVNDLLAYSRPVAPEVKPVQMRKLVVHAIELACGGNARTQGIEIELEMDPAVEAVDGDEALLRHALINIVDNALQAMPAGGTLTIRCRPTEIDGRPSIAVEFQDTGEGMDTLVRNKARDPFFTTRQTGTGLGLAIVDRVARVHGGKVEIESRHGLGTRVSFIVPRERSSIAPPGTFT